MNLPPPDKPTIQAVLDEYLLCHDLSGGTPDYYRRVVGVLCHWHGRPVLREEFTATLVNQFLAAKQEAGRSSYYRRSLRSGLRALLRFAHGTCERLRPVKCAELESDTWTPQEVGALAYSAGGFRLLIMTAYFTGLSECDLRRLRGEDISQDGAIRFRRQKTGKTVLVGIPPELRAELPAAGLLFPLRTSGEYFRRMFRVIVKAAGLKGTFKKLRRSSGTEIELLHPGRGHIHLGNTRPIFEAHYWDKRRAASPMMPPNPGWEKPAV